MHRERCGTCYLQDAEIDRFGHPCGQALVAKVSVNAEPSQLDFHPLCGKTQMIAAKMAYRFNEILAKEGIAVPRID